MICNAAVPVFIFISKGSRREMAARESLASQGRRREPGRQPPGVLHISRDPWGRLEGALRAPWGRLEGALRAPWGRLGTIARYPSDFPLIMAFNIVRKPSGYPPVPVRCTYGPSTAYYGLSTACLQSYCLMKTPRKLGAACSAHRRPHD